MQVAAARDPQSLALYVAHLLASWCEPQFDAQARCQEAKGYLQSSREPGGMLSGRFRLTQQDSEGFLAVLEPLARSNGLADGRDAGQRRADALVEVFGLALGFADLPDAGGLRPQLTYVIPAGWAAADRATGSFADLVGASLPDGWASNSNPSDADPSDADPSGGGGGGGLFGGVGTPVQDRCATGAWSGPQTRARIEALLCDARLSRVLLDPAGQVKSLEALGDTVTNIQRRALSGRDHGCAERGCTRPPAFCDAHHLDHLADGGTTDVHNLVLLCRHHHLRWHQGQLQLRHLHVPWLTGATATHQPPGRPGRSAGPAAR